MCSIQKLSNCFRIKDCKRVSIRNLAFFTHTQSFPDIQYLLLLLSHKIARKQQAIVILVPSYSEVCFIQPLQVYLNMVTAALNSEFRALLVKKGGNKSVFN